MSFQSADIVRTDRSVGASVHIACHSELDTVFHIASHIQLEHIACSDRGIIAFKACPVWVFQSDSSAFHFSEHCFKLSECRACRDAVEDLIACVKLN